MAPMKKKSFKRKTFEVLRDSLVAALNLSRGNSVWCSILEKAQPTVTMVRGAQHFTFATPNEMALWRARTLFSKEPETLRWIDSFSPDDVLFDIGANVGMYTVYAGIAQQKLRIIAFEPTFFNYWLLNTNIHLNRLQERVTAVSIALAEADRLDCIYMPSIEAASALVNFGESRDWKGQTYTPKFKQGSIAYSLDGFIDKFHPPFPNHLKIDVDGLEPKILEGAQRTLADDRLKSVSIELSESRPEADAMKKLLENSGLEFNQKKQSEMFANSEYKDIYNYVFRRRV